MEIRENSEKHILNSTWASDETDTSWSLAADEQEIEELRTPKQPYERRTQKTPDMECFLEHVRSPRAKLYKENS